MTQDQELIQKMYLGFYSRAADPGGMNYWADRLSKEGFPAIAMAFVTSPEASVLYTPERMAAANLLTFGVNPPVPIDPPAPAGKLVWQTEKSEALALARLQGKKVLLLGGRESCPTTTGMRDIACESLTPPIKALIEKRFVPWYGNSDQNTEYYFYMIGGEYSLPAICIIDPNNPTVLVTKGLFGSQEFTKLYNWMVQFSG